MQTVSLKKIEKEYQNRLKSQIDSREIFNADKLIEFSLSLFHELKVKGIPFEEDKESDMFLFQYGICDWTDEPFFKFDITRQFIKKGQDEPYQLSMALHFDPIECESYNCWSFDFENLEKWVENIKETEGYKLAKQLTCRKFEIGFNQC
jgi:hypothetical protein